MAERPVNDVSLSGARWPGLEERRPLLLVPVGSMEQHGPHLPLGTDAMVATSVTREAARHLRADGTDVLTAPALAYGASGEHEDFPGTVSIGHEALRLLLVELARSACRWAQGVIFVNGHGGNLATVVDAVRQLRDEGRAVAWTGCGSPDADAHAGHSETSILRFVAPWSVRTDLAVAGPTAPVVELMPMLRASGVRAVSPSGVLGDATTSSVADGRRIFTTMVARVVGELRALDVGEDGRLSGPPRGPGAG